MENVNSESAPSGTNEGGARRESDSAKEGGNVKRERDRFERIYRTKLHPTSCDWEQGLKLERRAKHKYDLVDSLLESRAGMVRDEGHTQVIGGLASLTGRVWTHQRHLEFLYGPSVSVWSRAVALRLREITVPVRRASAE